MARSKAREERGTVRVENLTRGQTIVSAGRVADTWWTGLRGLIGHKPLASGEGDRIIRTGAPVLLHTVL